MISLSLSYYCKLPKNINLTQFSEENDAIKAVAGNHLAEHAHTFAAHLQEGAIKENIATVFMGMKDAEAVEFFVNTYLA